MVFSDLGCLDSTVRPFQLIALQLISAKPTLDFPQSLLVDNLLPPLYLDKQTLAGEHLV